MGKNFRVAFVVFRIVLGAVIFLQSVNTLFQRDGVQLHGLMRSHTMILAIVEALAALLFLLPKTARVGGGMLLGVIAFVFFVHGIRGELPLLVYGAGIVLVMVEGGTYRM